MPLSVPLAVLLVRRHDIPTFPHVVELLHGPRVSEKHVPTWPALSGMLAGQTRTGAPTAGLTRDFRGSGGFPTMARSGGFHTMKIGFSVGVSTLKIGGNPHWSFVFPLV